MQLQNGTRIKFNKTQKQLLFACFAAYTGAYITRLNLSAMLPEMMTELSITKDQVGWMITVFAIVYAAGQLVNGAIADKVSPRIFIFTGLCGSIACNAVMSLPVGGYIWRFVVWGLNGAFQSMLWTPIVKLLADKFDGAARQSASLWLSFSLIIGHVIAWWVAGYISAEIGYRMGFLTCAGLTGICAAAFLLLTRTIAMEKHPEGSKTAEKANDTRRAAAPVSAIFAKTGLAAILLCCITNGIVRDSIINWGPTIIASSLSLDMSGATGKILIIPAINLLGLIIGRILLNKMRGGTRITVSVMMLLTSALSVGVFMLANNAGWAMIIFLGMCSALLYGMNPALTAIIPMEFEHLGRVGMVAGMVDCCIYIGSAASGAVIGMMAQELGWAAVYFTWVITAAAGGVLMLVSALKARRNGFLA